MRRFFHSLIGLSILFGQLLHGAAPETDRHVIRVIISSQDGSRSLLEETPKSWETVHPTEAPVILVDLTKKRQSLLGLGASFDHATCENLFKLTPEKRADVLEKLFGREAGIGMNLMRVCIGTSDFVREEYYTYDDLAEGETDPELAKFSIDKDRAYVLPIIKLAQQKNPNLLLFASPWSPPAWMKTSSKLGTGRVMPKFYPAFAEYLLKFIQAYEAEGLPIYAITVQNEPQHQDARYPTTLWSATEQRDFIRDHLGPLFERQNIRTKIWCWDHNWNQIDFPRTILADAQAARYVDGTGFHHYEGNVEAQSILAREFPDKHIYFTEGSVFRTRGALRLIDILRHGSRSYNAWVVMLDEHRKPNRGPHSASATCVELLDDRTVRYNYDYYMQGQFMKYIQRDAVRLETPQLELHGFGHVAFINPNGQVVLVAANARRDPQTFAIQCGNWMFEADLPAESVATYLYDATPNVFGQINR